MMICLHCGLEFAPLWGQQKMCSRECAKARNSQRAKARYRRGVQLQRPCRQCGLMFARRPGFALICSVECRRVRARASEKRRGRTWQQLRQEGGARYQQYRARSRIRNRLAYHRNVQKQRAKGVAYYRRCRELMLKGLALERLQQEGLL